MTGVLQLKAKKSSFLIPFSIYPCFIEQKLSSIFYGHFWQNLITGNISYFFQSWPINYITALFSRIVVRWKLKKVDIISIDMAKLKLVNHAMYASNVPSSNQNA